MEEIEKICEELEDKLEEVDKKALVVKLADTEISKVSAIIACRFESYQGH